MIHTDLQVMPPPPPSLVASPFPPFSRKGSDPPSSPPDERGGVRHGAGGGDRGCGDGGAGRILGPHVLHTGKNEQEEREGESFSYSCRSMYTAYE